MSDVKRRLVAALHGIVAAIDDYVEDASQSGCDNYDLDRFAQIPSDEPMPCRSDDDPTWRAWRIKVVVMEAEKVYFQLNGEAQLPRPGLTFWKDLLVYTRVHKDAAAIYTTADRFREWAKAEASRLDGELEPATGTGTELLVPTPLQESILAALKGRALKKEALAGACKLKDGRPLYRPGGLNELQAAGLVEHKDGVGYYRPDAPPPGAIRLPPPHPVPKPPPSSP